MLVINVTLVVESLQIVGDAALHFYSRVTLQGVVFVIVQDCHHSPSESVCPSPPWPFLYLQEL